MRNQRKQDDERISCEPNSPAACESICSGECCLPVLMLALSKHAIVVSSWPRQSICQSCCRWHCTGSHLSKQQTRATGAGERPAAAPNPPATSFIKHQRHVATEVTNPPLHRDRCASYYPQIQTNALGDLSGRHTDGAPREQTTGPTGFVNSAARCVLCRRTRQAGMKTGGRPRLCGSFTRRAAAVAADTVAYRRNTVFPPRLRLVAAVHYRTGDPPAEDVRLSRFSHYARSITGQRISL